MLDVAREEPEQLGRCNVCGGTDFVDMNSRPRVYCRTCQSLERSRAIKLLLDADDILKPGMRVLHFAPETGLAKHIRSIVGHSNYDARDIDTQRYAKVGVACFDLVKDADTLPQNHFDVIIHNHVMEHLPCNVTAILWHLHNSLSQSGYHIFSIPILDGSYEETQSPITDEERTERFGQFDHVRRFGVEDLDLSIGMIFSLPRNYNLYERFSAAELDAINIPNYARKGWSGHSVFILRKNDLLLRPKEALPAPSPSYGRITLHDHWKKSSIREAHRQLKRRLRETLQNSLPTIGISKGTHRRT
jgi:hypothetical protein